MKELQTFKRGQVWYIDDKMKYQGSIQGKSRPYLVVSNDKCNSYSSVIHMAPITSQDKSDLPTHVGYFDHQKKIPQVVLLEQTMPKSIPDISPVAEYKYSLSEDKMKEVDRALATQFALPYSGVSLEDLEEVIFLMKEKAMEEVRAEANKITEDRVRLYVDKILDGITTPAREVPTVAEEVVKSEVTKRPQSQIEKFNQRYSKSTNPPSQSTSEVPVPVPIASGKRAYRKWSMNDKANFIKDYKELGVQGTAEKYGLAITTVRSTYLRFKAQVDHTSNNSDHEDDPEYKSGPVGRMQYMAKFVEDYDKLQLSDFMEKYHLNDRAAVIERVAAYRIELDQ